MNPWLYERPMEPGGNQAPSRETLRCCSRQADGDNSDALATLTAHDSVRPVATLIYKHRGNPAEMAASNPALLFNPPRGY